MEELQEIQDAIAKVKESEEAAKIEVISEELTEEEIEIELKEEKELKEAMVTDFSDMDEFIITTNQINWFKIISNIFHRR